MKFRKGQIVWARGVVVEEKGEFCDEVAVIRFSPTAEEMTELEGSAHAAQCAEVELKDLRKVRR